MNLPLHKHPWEVLDKNQKTVGHFSNVAAARDKAFVNIGSKSLQLGKKRRRGEFILNHSPGGKLYILANNEDAVALKLLYDEERKKQTDAMRAYGYIPRY